MGIDLGLLEQKSSRLAEIIINETRKESLSVFNSKFYTGKLMEWAVRQEAFKTNLFRFVDVLPSLTTSSSIIRHVQEYFSPIAADLPGAMRLGLNIDPQSLPAKAIARLIHRQVRSVAEQFILGESPEKALSALTNLRKNKWAFTVDLLGESVVSEKEAGIGIARYEELLDVLNKEKSRWETMPLSVPGHRFSDPLNISIKLSWLYSQAKPISFDLTVANLSDRLARILKKAMQPNATVYVDMEDSSFTAITLETFCHVLESSEFRNYDRCGIVLQAYLRRTKQDLQNILTWTKKRGTPIAVRLVKGAYWDTESIVAKQRHWPIPVWQEKASSDKNYEDLTLTLLENSDMIFPAFGSHNIRSLAIAVTAAELLGVKNSQFEIQTLYGMSEPINKAFSKRNYLVRVYAPIGELIPGMGYLVRRLLENTSNEGFLRQGFQEDDEIADLIAKPSPSNNDDGCAHLKLDIRKQFFNTAPTDFSLLENRSRQQQAFTALLSRHSGINNRVYPIIAGKEEHTINFIPSVAVEDRSQVLAHIHLADAKVVEKAIASLYLFFPTWRETPLEKRCEVLFKTAEILLNRREQFVAAIVLESGKQWEGADADLCEAVDFLNYYAHEAKRLFALPRTLGNLSGERNIYFYEPRGVTAVIGPWNFPLAIPCGMFSAAIVSGNCAVLKPAEQSSYIASLLFSAFIEGGLPTEAAAFLPGIGEEIGPQLVEDPRINTIVFTGSKSVGLELMERAAKSSQNAPDFKRVIIETGGKNAIIVDEDADLDEAVKGIIESAFGYQGQKCSACSRVIALEQVYERLLQRLTEATQSLVSGPASNPACGIGPVIDKDSFNRLSKCIEQGKRDCRLVVEGPTWSTEGKCCYIKPTIFTDVPLEHDLFRNELFGPVLVVLCVQSFDQALEMAVDSEYALTGAVFSRSPDNIAKAEKLFKVGNLYINRGSTGALVFRQPFGGFRMSGVGSKAGGPDYLLQFVVPRVITENTIRRGFAPSS